MIARSFFCFALALAATGALAEDPNQLNLTDGQFRLSVNSLMVDPLGPSASENVSKISRFVSKAPNVNIMLGNDERRWLGADKDRALVLLSAYVGGNALSQLNSGVPRSDRYSGLLCMFRVYRQMKDKDNAYRNPEVEALLKLHREDKLVAHLIDLDKRPGESKSEVQQIKGERRP